MDFDYMQKHDPDHDVKKINLKTLAQAANPSSTVIEPAGGQPHLPSHVSSMSMEQLRSNYESILRARGIFYPVAFQFLHELGRGRQGVVFLSLRQGARGCITQHAIKVFDPGIYRNSEEYWTDMGRLAAQVSRLQGMHSPNLVSLHSYDETYGIGYAQMEAIDGMDLRRLLSLDHIEAARRQSTDEEWARFQRVLFRIEGSMLRFQPNLVVYMLRRMIRGIERLHAANFLHSDVKPANVMVDRLGIIRTIDFGRAVMIGEKVTFLFGSPIYMAPEIHRREPGRPQSDFYSVGLVGLEMLRGEPLSDPDTTDEDALLRIKTELPDKLLDLIPPYMREEHALIKIIRKLLEPLPQNRYGSAKEADVGSEGLIVVDMQFARKGMTTDTGRVLSDYLSKLVDRRTGRIEIPLHPVTPSSYGRSEIIVSRTGRKPSAQP